MHSPDDTAYLDPTSPNGLNQYCYCGNDPSGRLAISLILTGCLIAFGVGAAIGGMIGGVPGFIVGTVAGVLVGVVINGIFYTEFNEKSIAGYIEDGIEYIFDALF